MSFVVTAHEAGSRLDRFLAQRLSAGRRWTARLFRESRVRLDGARVAKGVTVQMGQRVVVHVPPPDAASPEPGQELDVRLLRDDLVVVNKPAGMPSVALRAGERGTLAGALLGRFPEMARIGYGIREPGLVHRLDTFTSGLLMAARSAQAFDALREALSQGRLRKRYLAAIPDRQVPAQGSLRARLAPHPKNRKKVVALAHDAASGRPATADYRVLQRSQGVALLEISVGAAYRHQIRALLASRDWPIVGDLLYGSDPGARLAPGRHALHASYIRCEGAALPDFEVVSELPQDIFDLLKPSA